MAIDFQCPKCSKMLRVPDGSEGLQSECPVCFHVMVVPGKASSAVAATIDSPSNDNHVVNVPCPKCLHLLACSPTLLGKKGRCPQCSHIFTIKTDLSASAAVEENTATNFVFTCPACGQLFEGKEEMHGRKGKCHVCQCVFVIEIKKLAPTPLPNAHPESKAEPLTQKSVHESPKSSETAAKTSSTPSHRDDSRKQARPSVPVRPIRFACHACTGILEVPGSTVGLETACPFCSKILTIPDPSQKRP